MLKLIKQSSILRDCIRFGFARASRNKKPKVEFKDKEEEAFEAASQDFMKDAFEQYRGKAEKDSVLKDFRRDIFRKEEVPEFLREADRIADIQQAKINKALDDDQPEKVRRFSKKLLSKFVNKQSVIKNRDLFKDQTDYTVYDSNYTRVTDRRLGHNQQFNRSDSTKRAYKFIEKLPDDYSEKHEVRQVLRDNFKKTYEDMTVAQFGQQLQERGAHARMANDAQYDIMQEVISEKQLNSFDPHDRMNPFDNYSTMITDNFDPSLGPVMSPQAIHKIYELYTQGWNVRDISRRFGILPARTKFYVWARAQLYLEVLPKSGVMNYIRSMQLDKLHAEKVGGYLDYGLDMEELGSPFILESIKSWETESVDVQRKPEEYSEALKKLEKSNKFDKYSMAEIGTHGKENKMYFLKEWNIFKGKGSNEYHLHNKTYRSLVKAKRKMLYSYY